MTETPRDLPPSSAPSTECPHSVALTETIYRDIRRIARAQLSRESRTHTLSATDLTHSVLTRALQASWTTEDRQHLMCRVGAAMRNYLIDHARKKLGRARLRRELVLTETATTEDRDSELVLAVAEALKRLENSLPRVAQVVELRWFAGMEYAEIATALGISIRTVGYDWALARAWLRSELALQSCA